MTQKGNVKKVFPGGNTSKGFHSFYDQIILEDVTSDKKGEWGTYRWNSAS
ncbi:MAG TPA: hypothetical protein VEB00_14360 [Clostridia bacterium]|nr:hypothetical protein [Clostridia bacterium]